MSAGFYKFPPAARRSPPSRQEFAQVREDVRKVDPVTARLAQIDDPVNFHLAEVIGKLASFQRLEQAADHCSFSHPRASHDGHQALRVIIQEVSRFVLSRSNDPENNSARSLAAD